MFMHCKVHRNVAQMTTRGAIALPGGRSGAASRRMVVVIAALVAFSRTAPAQSNGAEFVAQTVATSMVAGATQTVSITMKNSGATTWRRRGDYHLGSQNPGDNSIWGLGRVYLDPSERVAPQQTKTFTFTIRAPITPGTYNFQWRMVQETVEWFGDETPNLVFRVGSPSGVDARDHPRKAAAASSCVFGCENPRWSHRSLVDSSYEAVWSSVSHSTADGYEWFAFWFDGAHDTDYVRLIPRTHLDRTYCVPEFVTIYYSANGQWVPTGVSVNLSADSPLTGITIRIPRVRTDGILVVTNRLRAGPSGGYYFQMAEAYAGITDAASTPSTTTRTP